MGKARDRKGMKGGKRKEGKGKGERKGREREKRGEGNRVWGDFRSLALEGWTPLATSIISNSSSPSKRNFSQSAVPITYATT